MINAFERIFALTINKDGFIKRLWIWSGLKWEWHIHLTRILFDWEIKIRENFLNVLNSFSLSLTASDKVIWSYLINGIFSSKSFRIALEKSAGMKVPRGIVGKGSIHPKLNYFVTRI